MKNLNLIIYVILGILISIGVATLFKKNNQYINLLEMNKALEDSVSLQSAEIKVTKETLKFMTDSNTVQLDRMRKKLKIKDDQIQSMSRVVMGLKEKVKASSQSTKYTETSITEAGDTTEVECDSVKINWNDDYTRISAVTSTCSAEAEIDYEVDISADLFKYRKYLESPKILGWFFKLVKIKSKHSTYILKPENEKIKVKDLRVIEVVE